MDPVHAFSSKAEIYARYRWDYAPQAIQMIFSLAQLTGESTVADIGAGTGILTKHFIGKVKQVYAVEPNAEMRRLALQELGSYPGCQVIDGRAEATTLRDHGVDLIAVGQAFNWFDPQPSRAEFKRILMAGGWLAAVRNYGTDQELRAAVEGIYPAETDTLAIMKGAGVSLSFYYGGEVLPQTFPFTNQQTFEQFLGSLASASYAPEVGSRLYDGFARAARRVFDHFCTGGVLTTHAVTELYLGKIKM